MRGPHTVSTTTSTSAMQDGHGQHANSSAVQHSLAHDQGHNVPHAWVSLAFGNDNMMHRALVLFQSLRSVGTEAAFVMLCEPCGASVQVRMQAAALSVRLRRTMPPIPADDMPRAWLQMLKRWGVPATSYSQGVGDFAKLFVHSLEEYSRVVLLDGDILALRNLDNLFLLPEGSHSDGPLSPFNSGVIVIKPRRSDFLQLVSIARRAKYNESLGWHNEGPCTRPPCVARHVLQGLWHWWFVTRPSWVAPRLSRHVFNALHDPLPVHLNFEHVGLVHFTNCGKPQAESCRSEQLFAPLQPLKDRHRRLCEHARRSWAAAHARLCDASHGGRPPLPPPPPPSHTNDAERKDDWLHVFAHASGTMDGGVTDFLRQHNALCNYQGGISRLGANMTTLLRSDCLHSISTSELRKSLSNPSVHLKRRLMRGLIVNVLLADPFTWFTSVFEKLDADGVDAVGSVLSRHPPFFDAPSFQMRSFAWRRRSWALTLRLYPATNAGTSFLKQQIVRDHALARPRLGDRWPFVNEPAAHTRNASQAFERINERCQCDFSAADLQLTEDAQLFASLGSRGAELKLDANGEVTGISGFRSTSDMGSTAIPIRMLLGHINKN